MPYVRVLSGLIFSPNQHCLGRGPSKFFVRSFIVAKCGVLGLDKRADVVIVPLENKRKQFVGHEASVQRPRSKHPTSSANGNLYANYPMSFHGEWTETCLAPLLLWNLRSKPQGNWRWTIQTSH
jgi:hypothetical protein